MPDHEAKFLFYLIDEEQKHYYFYEWLSLKYKDKCEILYDKTFDLTYIEGLYPKSVVSLFIISFLKLDYEDIENFLKTNPRFNLPFILYLGKEENEIEISPKIRCLYIGKYFKNGVELTENDYLKYIENFIETIIIAEESIRRCLNNINENGLIFHSIKIETKNSQQFFHKFQQFLRENYKLMEETSIPEKEVEPFLPFIDNFRVELSQVEISLFIEQKVEEYFEIREEEFDIELYINTLIQRIKRFIYDQYQNIKEIWVQKKSRLWKEHNEKLIQKMNSQYIEFRLFLKKTKKIKYLRLKISEAIDKIKEKKGKLSLSARKLFAEDSFKNLLNEDFNKLNKEISNLFKYKDWKLYLKFTLLISLILSFASSIFFFKNLSFLHKFLANSALFLLLAFFLSWFVRQLFIKRQYEKIALLLEDSAKKINKQVEQSLQDFHYFMNEVVTKEILKRDSEFLINTYKDMLGVLDNYIYVFRNFDEFLSVISQDTPILIGTLDSIEQEIEITEDKIIEILESFPSFPSRSLLYNSIFNIMLDSYKKYFDETTNFKIENLKNKIKTAFERFWEYFPSNENNLYPVKGVIISPLREVFEIIPTQLQNILEGKLVEDYNGILIACFLKRN